MPLCGVGVWKFPLPLNFGFQHITLPDPYRGRVGGKFCRDSPIQTTRSCECKDGESCAATEYYIDEFKEVLNTTLPKRIAGFFAESIQGTWMMVLDGSKT